MKKLGRVFAHNVNTCNVQMMSYGVGLSSVDAALGLIQAPLTDVSTNPELAKATKHHIAHLEMAANRTKMAMHLTAASLGAFSSSINIGPGAYAAY